MDTTTDCRTEDGVTVGLIDSIIFLARVIAPRLETRGIDLGSHADSVQHALLDLEGDEDVAKVFGYLGAARKLWHQEHRAPTFEEMVRDMLADPELSEEARRIGQGYIFKLSGLDSQV
jgi:hypothetical protein